MRLIGLYDKATDELGNTFSIEIDPLITSAVCFTANQALKYFYRVQANAPASTPTAESALARLIRKAHCTLSQQTIYIVIFKLIRTVNYQPLLLKD
jgi:hypothetical protein